jgi:DNA-binding MarR family transcriptional regulator
MSQIEPFVVTLLNWMEVSMRLSMHNFILYTKDTGLSVLQMGAMFQIHNKGVSGVSDLGSKLGITSAGASQMLDRLVQQGLTARSEDPKDRRGKQIVMTEKGLRVLQESVRARQGWTEALAATLTAQEKEQVRAALNILIIKTNQLEADSVTILNTIKE